MLNNPSHYSHSPQRHIPFFIVLLLTFSILLTPSFSQGWVLDWADEFNVDGAPNPENWGYENGYVRNNEDQYYTRNRRENARVENGLLIIEARRDNWEGHEYTSASIITNGKHEWTYGRFELRAKIDIRQGSWPAWWTVGSARSWPGGGEIDMMEFYRGRVLFNTFCGNNCNGGWDTETLVVDDQWASEFHIWRMDWDEDFIELYLDDELMNTTDLSQTFVGNNNPFREPHWMFINQAIGGNNGGDPSNTEFPIVYEVDYVRVYQWDDDAVSVDPSTQIGIVPQRIATRNDEGKIHFTVPAKIKWHSLKVFNSRGLEIEFHPGSPLIWDASNIEKGVYFLKIDNRTAQKYLLF